MNMVKLTVWTVYDNVDLRESKICTKSVWTVYDKGNLESLKCELQS